jgi:hypothetical protein
VLTFTSPYPPQFVGIAAGTIGTKTYLVTIDGDSDQAHLFDITGNNLVHLSVIGSGTFDATNGDTLDFDCVGSFVEAGSSVFTMVDELTVVNGALVLSKYSTGDGVGGSNGLSILFSRSATPRVEMSGTYFGQQSQFNFLDIPMNGQTPYTNGETLYIGTPFGSQGQMTQSVNGAFIIVPENNQYGGYAALNVFITPAVPVTGSPFASYVSGVGQQGRVDALAIPAASCPTSTQ